MENIVVISNTKENTLEFDVDVQGIETDEMAVRFVIETGTMDLGFDSEKQAKNKWSVKIPALPILDTAMYPFHINIVVDGYNFTPLQGSVNVIGTHEVYASKPENITLAPAKRKAKEVVQALNTKPVDIGPPEPQQDTPPPDAPPMVKTDKKFQLEPLKVKKGSELFKTLMDRKPKVVAKKDDKLDDKIVGLMKKAKEEKAAQPEKIETPVAKTVEKPIEAATEKPIAGAKEEPKVAAPKKAVKKKVAAKKKVSKKKVAKKKTATKKESGAKSMAEKIIQSVTGLGKKQPLMEDNPNDTKIKDIIKEDSKPAIAAKTAAPKEAGAIKKISKDKTIIEVDASKEQKIKDVLKEDDSAEEKRSVTTKPFKKKNVTFH